MDESSRPRYLFERSYLNLPNELLENIFAQLPLSDLLSSYTHVCKSWTNVIMNPFFLPWKKMYLSIKLKRKSIMSASILSPLRKDEYLLPEDIMKTLVRTHCLHNIKTFFINCIIFMGKIHRTPDDFNVCCEILKKHRLYQPAIDYLNWVSDSFISKPFNIWHLATTIIILAENVWDVRSLITLILSSSMNFTPTDVVESFYSLATIFLHAFRNISLPPRYHYVVYYALYLYENSWKPPQVARMESPIKHAGQQSMLNYVTSEETVLTHEQAKIVNHDIQKHHVVKIVAFAGTGKTTTLLRYCRARPHLRFLLVVYNKSVQEHCQKVFPPNTTVRTAHALAFAHVGRRYMNVKKFDSNLKPMKILDLLEEKTGSGNRYKRAGLVKATLDRFINSSDPLLTLQHVPVVDKNKLEITDEYRLKVILDDSQRVWREMTLCTSSQRISMTQDGQLKGWQLNKPQIVGYDVIMIDEGQDMNPTMFDIFLNQDAAKIIVGDPYQQIYAFRGATNALQSVNATHTFFLTQSFRFGPEIGYVGHCILEKLLKVSKSTLVGGANRDTILADPKEDIRGVQKAYLCRTNFRLYKLALNLCKNPKYEDKKLGFAGGIEKVGLEDVLDIYKMVQMSKGYGTAKTLGIKNKLISKFSGLSSLMSFAENVEDKELAGKIAMYRYSEARTLQDVSLLRKRCKFSGKMANIILSTIHKAKGLEWDWVILADDIFPDGITSYMKGKVPETDLAGEYNLLYVAATRAKKKLTLNTAVLQTLFLSKEKLEKLVSSLDICPDTLCLQCGRLCLDGIEKEEMSPVITKVPTLPLSCDGYVFKGGYICVTCANIPLFELPYNPSFKPISVLMEDVYSDRERLFRQCLVQRRKKEGQAGPAEEEILPTPFSWDSYKGNRTR